MQDNAVRREAGVLIVQREGGRYWRAPGEGTTDLRSEAHVYELSELDSTFTDENPFVRVEPALVAGAGTANTPEAGEVAFPLRSGLRGSETDRAAFARVRGEWSKGSALSEDDLWWLILVAGKALGIEADTVTTEGRGPKDESPATQSGATPKADPQSPAPDPARDGMREEITLGLAWLRGTASACAPERLIAAADAIEARLADERARAEEKATTLQSRLAQAQSWIDYLSRQETALRARAEGAERERNKWHEAAMACGCIVTVGGGWFDGRRERLATLTAEKEAVKAENKALREIISKCATAIGNGACVGPECSLEFMGYLPAEIAGVTGKLRAEKSAVEARVGELEGEFSTLASEREAQAEKRSGIAAARCLGAAAAYREAARVARTLLSGGGEKDLGASLRDHAGRPPGGAAEASPASPTIVSRGRQE